MLIRSQDKSALWNISSILSFDVYYDYSYSNKFPYGIRIYHATSAEFLEYIGLYTSEKKALKVLDMIEECYRSYPNNVFEMPKEDELG